MQATNKAGELQPLVSIIIPTYNRAHFIGETLDSVIAQTFVNWECIVVDDGSNDYTCELLKFYSKKDSRIRFYHRPKDRPKGANACRNYGFELSSGELVIWFDSDDLMLSNFIEDGLQCFHRRFELDLVLTDYDIFSDSEKRIFHCQRNKIKNLSLDYFTGKINFGCQHVIWRRVVVENFRFNEHLSRAQELDFHLQIFSNHSLIHEQLKGSRVLVRRHNHSLTANFYNQKYSSLKSELDVRKKILGYLSTVEESFEAKISALKIYLRSFFLFIKKYSLKESLQELHTLENHFVINKKYRKWKMYFLLLLVLFKITQRDYRLKMHLKKLAAIQYGGE